MKSKQFVLAFSLAITSFAAGAADQDLGTVTVRDTVTASPVSSSVDSYGSQKNTVTREQIERQQSMDVNSAVRNVPGVMISSGTLLGGRTGANIFIRGRGMSHPSPEINITFDGVPRMGVLYGQSLFDALALSSVASIDVYKSPQLGQFGSGYASVNLSARRAEEEGDQTELSVSGGSFGTVSEEMSTGYKSGAYDLFVAENWTATDGHRSHSRVSQGSLFANLGYALNDHWNIRLVANKSKSQTLDPKNVNTGVSEYERFDAETLLTTLTLSHDYEDVKGYTKIYWNDTDYDLLGESAGTKWSRQSMKMFGVRAKETIQISEESVVVLGIDVDKSKPKNTQTTYKTGLKNEWNFPEMTMVSPYVQGSYDVALGEWTLTPSLGLRAYGHNEFKDKMGYQAGLVLTDSAWTFNANYARGVNYPSAVVIQGLVKEGERAVRGWREMKPEVVDHYEIGAKYSFENGSNIGITGFVDDGKDRFRAVMANAKPFANALLTDPESRYKIRGLEIAAEVKYGESLNAFFSATYMKSKARGSSGLGAMAGKAGTFSVSHIAYSPKWMFKTGVDYAFCENWNLYADAQYITGLYGGTSGRGPGFMIETGKKLKDVMLVNAKLSRKVVIPALHVRTGEAYLAINNLLDKDYQWIDGYPMPGVNAMLGLKLRF